MPGAVKSVKTKDSSSSVVSEADYEEYLRLEAQRRGVSVDLVRAEEEAAAKQNEVISPSIERLRRLAANSAPPEKYWQHDDEQKPF